jgi:hypothetical protein
MGRAIPITISRMMPPPTSVPKASELRDTKIDPRGAHLTINKSGRRRRKSGGGRVDGRTMTTDDDDDGCIIGRMGGG